MRKYWSVLIVGVSLVACSGTSFEREPEADASEEEQNFEATGEAEEHLIGGPDFFQLLYGKSVFEDVAFLGNGRTCRTCHLKGSGTINASQIVARLQVNPFDPIAQPLDDDVCGARGLTGSNRYTLLKRDATFCVDIPVPSNVTLYHPGSGSLLPVDLSDTLPLRDVLGRKVVRSAHHVRIDANSNVLVLLRRGVPTTNNTLFEDALMHDGREGRDLVHQGKSAVLTHYQPLRPMTNVEAEAVAAFQESIFSRPELKTYALTGVEPSLPPGNTPSEIRGRDFFDASTPRGLCAMCHGGPLLNTTQPNNPVQLPGLRFTTNTLGPSVNPLGYSELVYRFILPTGVPFGGQSFTMLTSDPGRTLITGNPCSDDPAGCVIRPVEGNNVMKIPSLWSIKGTAPYFHDGAAKTLDQVMDERYIPLFQVTGDSLGIPELIISPQDRDDILAYLQLL